MVVASQGVAHQFTTNHMACHLTPGRNGIPHTCGVFPVWILSNTPKIDIPHTCGGALIHQCLVIVLYLSGRLL